MILNYLGFNNLEEVAEKTAQDRDCYFQYECVFRGMKESAAIDYEKLMEHTPTPESESLMRKVISKMKDHYMLHGL